MKVEGKHDIDNSNAESIFTKHLSEDHYPIKRVVVFFYLHGVAKKVLIVRHTPEKCLKNEILPE